MTSQRIFSRCEHRQNARIDRLSIGENFLEARSRKASRGARMARSNALVIRIEEVIEARGERLMVGFERAEHERFEEPRRMREVPLRRAGIGHRLQHHVFGRERSNEIDRCPANRFETRCERHGSSFNASRAASIVRA